MLKNTEKYNFQNVVSKSRRREGEKRTGIGRQGCIGTSPRKIASLWFLEVDETTKSKILRLLSWSLCQSVAFYGFIFYPSFRQAPRQIRKIARDHFYVKFNVDQYCFSHFCSALYGCEIIEKKTEDRDTYDLPGGSSWVPRLATFLKIFFGMPSLQMCQAVSLHRKMQSTCNWYSE